MKPERILEEITRAAHQVPHRGSVQRRGGLRDDVASILHRRSLARRGNSPSGIRGALNAIVLRYSECVGATKLTLPRYAWEKLGALPQPLITVSDLWDALDRAGHNDLQSRLRLMHPVAWLKILDVLNERQATLDREGASNRPR